MQWGLSRFSPPRPKRSKSAAIRAGTSCGSQDLSRAWSAALRGSRSRWISRTRICRRRLTPLWSRAAEGQRRLSSTPESSNAPGALRSARGGRRRARRSFRRLPWTRRRTSRRASRRPLGRVDYLPAKHRADLRFVLPRRGDHRVPPRVARLPGGGALKPRARRRR